jgi:uncharacterized protein
MKKRWTSLLLLAALLSLLALPVLADSDRELPLVCDTCGLLTEEQEEALNEKAEQYSAAYDCDIVLIVVPDTEGYDVETYTEEVYRYYSFGWGADRSGVILLLSMEERDYDLAAFGYGNTAFTDYGKEWLMDDVKPYLKKNDWNAAFSKYIDLCAEYLRKARDGRPVDSYGALDRLRGGFHLSLRAVVYALIAGLIAALVVNGILKSKMKSAVLASRADDYLAGDLQLGETDDRFLKKDVTRVRRDRGSGSGHGTSVRSSGFSHHSGKF